MNKVNVSAFDQNFLRGRETPDANGHYGLTTTMIRAMWPTGPGPSPMIEKAIEASLAPDSIDMHGSVSDTASRVKAAQAFPDFVSPRWAAESPSEDLTGEQAARVIAFTRFVDSSKSVLSRLPHPAGWRELSRFDYVQRVVNSGKLTDKNMARFKAAIEKDLHAFEQGDPSLCATPAEYLNKELVPCKSFEELTALRNKDDWKILPVLEKEFAFAWSFDPARSRGAVGEC